MLSRVKNLLDCLRTTQSRRTPFKHSFARLHFDVLETREVPATASGIISGAAFVDTNANGFFDASDGAITGVTITLSGQTTQNVQVNNVTTVTDQNGAYRFDNVLPGTYTIQGIGTGTPLNGSTTVNVVGGQSAVVTMTGSENLNRDIAVTLAGELPTTTISLLMFLNTSAYVGSDLGVAGTGNALANFRANNTPTISNALANLTVSAGAVNNVFDLAGRFTDADYTNSQVTFQITANGQQVSIPVTLFDGESPQTVSNFFNYVTSNQYDNSIFHRLAKDFVLQGGAVTLNPAGTNFNLIDTGNNKVPNEFGRSNTQGTLSMAQSNNDINSATDQFFFNLGNNSGSPSNLDSLKFAVFGQVADTTALSTLLQLNSTPIKNMKTSTVAASFPTVTFGGDNNSTTDGVPMNNYLGTPATFPGDASSANYLVINDVTVDRRDEFLTYNVTVNVTSGPSNLVVATRSNEFLTLSYPTGLTGTATVTVTATDRFGASNTTSFDINVT